MKRIVKVWGDSLGVYLTKDDVKIFNIKVGDVVEVIINKPADLKKAVRRKYNANLQE